MCGFWEQPGKLTDDKEAKVTRHSGCSTAVYIEPVLRLCRGHLIPSQRVKAII